MEPEIRAVCGFEAMVSPSCLKPQRAHPRGFGRRQVKLVRAIEGNSMAVRMEMVDAGGSASG